VSSKDPPRPFVALHHKEERGEKHVLASYIDRGPRPPCPRGRSFPHWSGIGSSFTTRALGRSLRNGANSSRIAKRRLPAALPIFRMAAPHCFCSWRPFFRRRQSSNAAAGHEHRRILIRFRRWSGKHAATGTTFGTRRRKAWIHRRWRELVLGGGLRAGNSSHGFQQLNAPVAKIQQEADEQEAQSAHTPNLYLRAPSRLPEAS
jgi:hypothetical protein